MGKSKVPSFKEVESALLKKALGYDHDEVVEEYALDEGEEKLVKKKVTKKHFSPDVSAVKILLERYYQTYQEKISLMSDEELEKEEKRLLKLLKEAEDES